MTTNPTTYIIELRHVGPGDSTMTLRLALKRLWRVHRLRCLSVREVGADAADGHVGQPAEGEANQ